MAREIRIKQGASLLLQMAFVDDNGAPVDLTNATLTAQLRDPVGDLVATLPIVISGMTGIATITVPDTHLWPTGGLRTDIRCVTAGLVVISETVGVRVERAVTQS